MPNFKIVVSDPKSKKAYQKEVDQSPSGLIGKKIGDQADGGALGLSGYKLEITGGSDRDGFPMRKDVDGVGRKRIVLSSGPGFNPERRGERRRKSVRGNTISADTMQINTKVVTHGQKSLDELFGAKPKEQGEPTHKETKPKPKSEGLASEEKEKKEGDEKKAEQKEKPKEEHKKEEVKEQHKPPEEAKEKPHPEAKKDEHTLAAAEPKKEETKPTEGKK